MAVRHATADTLSSTEIGTVAFHLNYLVNSQPSWKPTQLLKRKKLREILASAPEDEQV